MKLAAALRIVRKGALSFLFLDLCIRCPQTRPSLARSRGILTTCRERGIDELGDIAVGGDCKEVSPD